MLPRVFLITDRRETPRPLPEAVRLALEVVPTGSASILLREKDLDGGPLIALARELRAITADLGARLFISSRWDVALAVQADGVHLGFDAPPASAVRAHVGSALVLGASLHGDETAPPEVDYAFISPVFPTRSKPGVTPLGIDGLRRACERHPSTPLFALGGISTPEHLKECVRAGAYGVAMLSAVLTSDDPGAHLRGILEALRDHNSVAE